MNGEKKETKSSKSFCGSAREHKSHQENPSARKKTNTPISLTYFPLIKGQSAINTAIAYVNFRQKEHIVSRHFAV